MAQDVGREGELLRPGGYGYTTSGSSSLGGSTSTSTTSNQPDKYKHTGIIPSDGGTVLVSETTFTAKDGYNYKATPTIEMTNLVYGGYDYSNFYQAKIVPTLTNGAISSFKAQVFYTPPQDGLLFPDPPDFEDFNHTAIIDFKMKPNSVKLTNTITHVVHNNYLTHDSQTVPLEVFGTPGAQYNIQITKQESITSNNITTDGYYDFNNGVFQSLENAGTFTNTIASNSKNTYFINLPYASSDTRYDVIITSAGASLATPVPTGHGDSSMIQYGLKTMTLRPLTYTSDFATMPDALSIQRHPDVDGLSYNAGNKTGPVYAVGGNGNVSGTKIILTRIDPNIKEGMYVLGLSPTATSSPHGIKVVNINKDVVVLSSAWAVPDETELKFQIPDTSIIPFDFTVHGSGKSLYVTGDGRQPVISDVGGIDWEVNKEAVGKARGSSIVVDSSGIVPKMTVSGEGIQDGTTVTAVPTSNSVTLSKPVTVETGANLTFSGKNGDTKILNIHAYDYDGGIRILGLLRMGNLGEDATASIYIDNFIKTV